MSMTRSLPLPRNTPVVVRTISRRPPGHELHPAPVNWENVPDTFVNVAEMARFNYGSTVIVLLPKGAATLDPALHAESPVRLGQRLALRE